MTYLWEIKVAEKVKNIGSQKEYNIKNIQNKGEITLVYLKDHVEPLDIGRIKGASDTYPEYFI